MTNDCITAPCGCAMSLDHQGVVIIEHVCEMHLAIIIGSYSEAGFDASCLEDIILEIKSVLI